MPNYVYPPQAEEATDVPPGDSGRPRVYFPVSAEQAGDVEIDQDVEMTVKGVVRGIQIGENYTEITVELISSDVYGQGMEITEAEEQRKGFEDLTTDEG